MQNLADKIGALPDPSGASEKSLDSNDPLEVCAACGEELFGPYAEASSWRSWSPFWKILGMSNVELVCGACGEYLSRIFARMRSRFVSRRENDDKF